MKVGCDGDCTDGHLVCFPQKGLFYRRLTAERARVLVAETLIRGHILFDPLHIDPLKWTPGSVIYDPHTGFIASIDDSLCIVQVAG